jgi:hypothetical protein
MTELEARNLKVGDMILFYDDSGFNRHDHLYAEEVEGIIHGVDIGLVLENNGNHVRIEWFSEDEETYAFGLASETIWQWIEKA